MSAPGAFELRLPAGCALGESPVWIAADQRLAFVDVPGRAIHLYDPATGGHELLPVREDIGCVAPSTTGGFLAGLRSGLDLLDPQGRFIARLAQNPEDPSISRFNDGKVDPFGRMLAGTIDEPKAGGMAALYRLERHGLVRLKTGLTTSNGLAFSPDGRRLYHADTPRFTVFAHDYDPASGEMGEGRPFIRFDPSAADRARPDGAAVDAEGCYWTALWDGGRLARYDPEGRLMSEHKIAARRPTMPAFGGPGLKTLYVTTAKDGEGSGGGLYALESDVAGLPIAPFDPRTAPSNSTWTAPLRPLGESAP